MRKTSYQKKIHVSYADNIPQNTRQFMKDIGF